MSASKRIFYDDKQLTAEALAKHLGRAAVLEDRSIALYSAMDWVSEDGEPSEFVLPLSRYCAKAGDILWHTDGGKLSAKRVGKE